MRSDGILRTYTRSKIRRDKDPDTEIILYFSDDLDCVVDGEMCVLSISISIVDLDSDLEHAKRCLLDCRCVTGS